MNSSSPAPKDSADDAAASNSALVASASVPQLSEFGITQQDLATAIRVLDAVSSLDPKNKKKKRKANDNDDGLAQYRQPNLRLFRKSLSTCLSLHKQTMYEGKSEMEYYEQQISERTLKRQKMAERAQQKKYVAATDLRRGRLDKLAQLREDSKEEEEAKLMQFLIPDGHVDTNVANNGIKMLENGDAIPEDGKQMLANGSSGNNEAETVLPKLRSCYACKVRFRILHHFYDQLCPDCAPINYTKRHQSADMSNMVAVVTGSRVKIGFQVCLKLLRAGATVVATTRFPNNAVAAYRREKDFEEWKGRLHVYALDFRDVTGLEAFTRFLKVTYGDQGIDMLINNACQTVRRPGGYYMPLVEREGELWTKGDEVHRDILRGCTEFERIRRRLVTEHSRPGHDAKNGGNLLSAGFGASGQEKLLIGTDSKRHDEGQTIAANTTDSQEIVANQNTSTNNHAPFESTGISHSAAMSQMAIVPEDVGVDEKIMPPGLSDINGQQLDLRSNNSWLLKMDQVSTPEIMECMFINAIAPFVLNSRLKPLMEAPMGDVNRPDRYIINVSAMEGKFYRYKMPNHPHTNMAKAALNMLTRTSSEELAKKSRIFMNSVDTGWINDENPLEKASKIAETNNFQTPIDEVDAAARILDPVFVGVNLDKETKGRKSVKDYGKFFKDYKETEW
mmetsp:Transcript_22694/g.40627  ORF Transcript_22694/g.40627 Transcript_22694/m.40627 type:complete len:676 (-) Transcript_22694:20-2047(-)